MSVTAGIKDRTRLTEYVLDNFTRFWTCLETEMHFSVEKTHFLSGIAHPLFNGVLRTQLPTTIAHKRIEETIAQFKRRHLPFSWWICERSHPQNLSQQLENHGFIFEGTHPSLIWAGSRDPQTEMLEGFKVLAVSDLEMMNQWTNVYSRTLDLPKDVAAAYSALFTHGAPKPFRHFLGLLEGEPVAAATLFFQPQIAAIYNVAVIDPSLTVPLTAYLVAHAKQLHYPAVMLQASSSNIDPYRQVGFDKICEFQVYTHC